MNFPHGRMNENKYDPIKRSEETAKVIFKRPPPHVKTQEGPS